jgi:DNA-binding MarR family transcriptional regulator
VSSSPPDRAALLAELTREMRWGSARSVLVSHLAAERTGLHETDLESLDILALTGPILAGRLAELTGLTTGAVTALIDRLEAAGCVRREPDPADRRRVIVRPLPWPESLMTAVAPLYAALESGFGELCARYSDKELAFILDFLRAGNAVGAAAIAQARQMPATAPRPLTEERSD